MAVCQLEMYILNIVHVYEGTRACQLFVALCGCEYGVIVTAFYSAEVHQSYR
jgi:hypothetical protein